MPNQVVLRTRFYWMSLVLAVWSFVILPATIDFTVLSARTHSLKGLTAVGIVATMAAIVLGIRIALTNVLVTSEGVKRRSAFRGRSWAWADIKDFEIRADPMLGLIAMAIVRKSSDRAYFMGLARLTKHGRDDLQRTISELRAELRTRHGRHPD
jgi:hypothetical protein